MGVRRLRVEELTIEVVPAATRVGRVPLRVRNEPALRRTRVADVRPIEAVVDLNIAVLVEVHAVTVTTGIEAEDRVGLVDEPTVGVGVGDHRGAGESEHRGKGQRDVVGHPHVDLVLVVPGRYPDLDRRRNVGGRLGDPAAVIRARRWVAVAVPRRIDQTLQGIDGGLTVCLPDHARGQVDACAGGELLGAGQGAGVGGVLHVAALEVEPPGIEPERDDPKQGCGGERHDHEALCLLAATQLDQHFSTPSPWWIAPRSPRRCLRHPGLPESRAGRETRS